MSTATHRKFQKRFTAFSIFLLVGEKALREGDEENTVEMVVELIFFNYKQSLN